VGEWSHAMAMAEDGPRKRRAAGPFQRSWGEIAEAEFIAKAIGLGLWWRSRGQTASLMTLS
jgi:hypothetical protein